MPRQATSRVIWNGSISFGLVHVPVELRTAEQSDELKLNLLDARDHAPVGLVRTNKQTGEAVPWEQVVKGYAVEKGRYVILDDDDLKRANVKATQTIEIVGFVDAAEISPLHFERPYFLSAASQPAKGYALLRETLRNTGKAGVALVVLHTRQHLAALIPVGDVLVLNLLRFAHELRDASGIAVPPRDLKEIGVKPAEVAMAERLVEDMSGPWQPELYRDQYRDDLLALIEKKARAKGIEEIPAVDEPATPGGQVIDLMALLEQSLQGRKKGTVKKAEPARPALKRVAPPAARGRKRG